MKGAVAERNCRQAVFLVIRNNIRFTVAFAECYQNKKPLIFKVFSDFLVVEQSAIFLLHNFKNGSV